MSEYSSNDHLHNVTASVQQLTYQAQGVQDITGANVADYEEISPSAGASVSLVNARENVPLLKLVNNLPPSQSGSGTPSVDNVRALVQYSASIVHIVHNGDVQTLRRDFPSPIFGGYYDWLSGRLYSDIKRVRIPSSGWTAAEDGAYTNTLPADIKAETQDTTRWCAGENIPISFGWGSASTGEIVIRPDSNGTLVFAADPEILADADAVNEYFDETEFYVYYRVKVAESVYFDSAIIYTAKSNYAMTADYGTLTIQYQGIAPDEP